MVEATKAYFGGGGDGPGRGVQRRRAAAGIILVTVVILLLALTLGARGNVRAELVFVAGVALLLLCAWLAHATRDGWRADRDPSAGGNSAFGTYRDASIALWAYERNVEKGPVFGEGKYHWFWSGLLDGVACKPAQRRAFEASGLGLADRHADSERIAQIEYAFSRVGGQASSGTGSPREWAPSKSTRYACSDRRCRRQVVCAESSRSMRRSPVSDWLPSESLR